MADQFDLTERAVTVTAPQTQPVWQAVDISAYDSLVVQVQCLNSNATTASIRLLTGMQKQTTSGYVSQDAYGLIANTSTYIYLRKNYYEEYSPLRYLLWDVPALTGTTPWASFFITCLGRKTSGR